MRLPGLLFLALSLAACDKSDQTTEAPKSKPDEVAAPRPTAALVDSCITRIDEWTAIKEKPLPEEDVQLQAIQKECGLLYARCGGADTAIAFIQGVHRERGLELADKCEQAYCGGFADPKPALCTNGRAALTGKDKEAARKGSLEFHAAMLAADVPGDAAALQSATERLADLWTGYGEVDMSGLGESVSVSFQVGVTTKGFVVQVGEPFAWKSKPDAAASTKLELGLLEPKGKGKKAPAVDAPLDPARWDYETLTKEAAALKAAYPEESTVTLIVDEKVPTEVQTRTMNALRGKDCKLEADDRPVAPAQCLYWRQILR